MSWRSFWQQWWLTFLFLLLICCVCCMQSEPAVLAALVTQCRQLGVDLPKAVESDQFLCSSARVQVWRSGAGSTGGCGTLVGSLGSEIRLSFSSSSAALLGLCLTSRPCCSFLGLSGHSLLHSCASSQTKHLPWLKNNTVKGGELVCLGYFWAGLVSPLIWLSVAMPRLFWDDAVARGAAGLATGAAALASALPKESWWGHSLGGMNKAVLHMNGIKKFSDWKKRKIVIIIPIWWAESEGALQHLFFWRQSCYF